MNKSEQIDKLAQSLSKLQSEIQNLYKDKTGYGYKYTELSSVLDVARPLCSKHELAITQLCSSTENTELVGVETMLMHSSGQYISSTLYMKVTVSKGMNAAQAAGSVITYARRYALAAMLGIAQTDNDASTHIEHVSEQPSLLEQVIDELKKRGLSKKDVQPWYDKFSVTQLSELNDSQLQVMLKELGVVK